LWLRGALAGDPFDTKAALRLANDYIDMLLGAPPASNPN
jgi:TetR/AcrR family transcriptional repressor of bet genes